MDTHNAVMDIQNAIIDIHNWIMKPKTQLWMVTIFNDNGYP